MNQGDLSFKNVESSSPESENLIGTFETEGAYLKAVKELILSSKETESRIQFVKDTVLPKIKHGSLLDVGVGNGELSRILCKTFKNIDLVDPCEEALSTIKKTDFLESHISKFCLPIERFTRFPRKYDFIVCSHTLYHIKREKWVGLVQNFVDALKPGGKLLIVLSDGLGRSKLTSFFGAKDVLQVQNLIEECTALKQSTLTLYPRYECLKPRSLESALKVAGVCLSDSGIHAHKHEVCYYLKRENYLIDFIQYFFVQEKT